MPRIPNISPAQPSPRVSRASVSRVGEMAIARTLGELGSTVENVTLDIMRKRTESEARSFSHNTLRKKTLESIDLQRDLLDQMNQETGTMPDGRLATEHYKEWVDGFSREADENAPSALAKENYKEMDRAFTLRSLAKMQTDMITATRQGRLKATQERVDEEAKSILSYQPTASRSVQDYTESLMRIEKNQLTSDTGDLYGVQEAINLDKFQGRKKAISAIENAFARESVPEILVMLDYLRDDPEARKALQENVKRDLKLEGGETIKLLTDGSVSIQKGNKIDFDTLSIGTEAQKPPSLISQYITAEDKLSYIKKLSSLLATKNREEVNELRKDIQNFNAGSMSLDEELKFRLGDGKTDGNLISLVGRIDKVNPKLIAPKEKEELKISMTASLALGNTLDSLKLTSPMNARRIIDNMDIESKRMLTALSKQGLMVSTDPLFFKQTALAMKRQAESFYESNYNELIQRGAGRLVEIDGRSKNLFNRVLRGIPNSMDTFTANTNRQLQRAGIPESVRKLVPQAYLRDQYFQFESLLTADTPSRYAQAAAWIQQKQQIWGDSFDKVVGQLEKAGFKREYVYAAQYPRSSEGLSAMSQIFDNMINVDANKNTILKVAPKTDFKELTTKAYGKIAPIAQGLLKQFNGKDDSLNIDAFTNIVTQEALRILKESGKEPDSGSMEDATQLAYDRLIKPFWISSDVSNSTMTVSKETMQKYGITESHLEGAARSAEKLELLKSDEEIVTEAIPDLDKFLNEMGIKDKAERNKKAKELILNGDLGEPTAIPVDGKVISAIRQDGRTIPILVKKKNQEGGGEYTGVPFRELKNNDTVLKNAQNPLFRFLGETFGR